MSKFSEKLKYAINRSKIPLSHLSAVSGLDITYISKMKSGERICSDVTKMKKLIDQLSLTPDEQYELLKLYKIARIGEENYRRYCLVKDIIESLDCVPQDIITQSYNHDLGNFHTVYGQTAVNHIVKAVLEKETAKKNGHIRILAQYDYKFLYEVLPLICYSNKNLAIDHIFYLKTAGKPESSTYNLDVLKTILPLILSHENYHPKYYYSETEINSNTFDLLPYAIITSEYVINISQDASSALMTRKPELLELFNRLYDNKENTTIELATRPKTTMEMSLHYSNFSRANDIKAIFSLPSLGEYVEAETACCYMLSDVEDRDFLVRSLLESASIAKVKPVSITTYFTMEGMASFLKTGCMAEYPQHIYRPFELSDRIIILSKLIDDLKSGAQYGYALKSTGFKMPENLIINALDKTRLSIVYIKKNGEQVTININESSVVSAFTDFLSELKADSDLVCTLAETTKQLEQLLKTVI